MERRLHIGGRDKRPGWEILNQDFLAGFLLAAGFDDMKPVERHGLVRGTSDMVGAGTPISLTLTAHKPAVQAGAAA